ncbi:aminoacyl-tRNA hydrolase [Lichenicola cladoniae]|uniref:Peptidyl-tRNA hydrolase n=1 Tax=Lichenicola cladoniae TaxID=1484109 RepID=A0A6M8HSU7_9PROT|nr:aminoacyl-tRNA hydrolase [Lichenicola cladoniae]NPD65513.1 aminoacyl-tRNA hydrolase [Acetobacteraceae bacterium]QKE91428.1 aminoacyl-tRNA hydrolase [Lichenicola cladoniae]
MLLWTGLGNPEPGMARQRHNIGFMAIDAIARRHGFSPWRKRFKGEFCEGQVSGIKVLALKPLTYMNASGESVQAAAAFYKMLPDSITAFHDELDLAPGRIRVKRGGGAAGHNGLRSMDRMLGMPDYWRVRLGIGHPGSKERVTGHVLGDFAKVDLPWLRTMLDAVADAAPLLAAGLPDGKPELFMTRVALLVGDQGSKDQN